MKIGFMCFGIICLLMLGCASQSYMPYNNTSQWDSFYTGGDGSSTAKAVVINSADDKKTIDAENNYIKSAVGTNSTYRVNLRSTYGESGRVYDKVEVIVDNNAVREFHFDISKSITKAN